MPLDEARTPGARPTGTPGALLIRDAGSPVDTRAARRRADLPGSSGPAGTSRRPSATSATSASRSTTRRSCPTRSAEQAARRQRLGQARRRLDRPGVGDLAPLWPDDVLAAAVDAAHAAGARVAAHVFGEEALPGLIGAGVDSVEHGTGLTDDLIDEMARRGTALVPTMINIDDVPAASRTSADTGSRPTPRTCARCTTAPATWSPRRRGRRADLRRHRRRRRHPARPDRGRDAALHARGGCP